MSPLTLNDVLALARARATDESTTQLRHALRNKLAAVKSAGFYLSRRLSGTAEAAADPRVAQFFQIIADETRAACDLIEATREPAPAAPPTAPPLDVGRVVAELVALLPPARALEPPAPVLAAIPRDDLVVAVHCLVENALEVASTVTVSVEGGPRTTVRVRDDGPGLAPGSVPPVRPGKRGLGLKLARRLATTWGGEVVVEPAERGASIALVLPAVAPAAPAAPAPTPPPAPAASRGRLLLVDDDDSVRVTLAALLEDAGWEVREAGSLAAARPLVSDLDVAVVDVGLRDGDGASLLPALRAASPDALAVLLSGDSTVARGAADLALLKGLDPLRLVDQIADAALARRRSS